MSSTPYCSTLLIYSTCLGRQRTYTVECLASDITPVVVCGGFFHGISLDFLSFCVLDEIFRLKKKNGFLCIIGPPYSGIGATIRIGREMFCLPYAGFFFGQSVKASWWRVCYQRGLPCLVSSYINNNTFFVFQCRLKGTTTRVRK